MISTKTDKFDLESFIDEVLTPAGSFAKICEQSNDNVVDLRHSPRARLEDVAAVVSALNSLSRFRMNEFAKQLQIKVGMVDVEQASYAEQRIRVHGVEIKKGYDPEKVKQAFDACS